MKIIYFLRDITDCGGIQQTTCNNINSLLVKNQNYVIKTVSLYHSFSKPFFDLDERVQNIALFNNQINQYLSFFSIKKQLKKILSEQGYDLLIVQGTAFSIFLPKGAWNKKVIVCEHGHYGMGTSFGIHAFGKRKALRKASAIVTLTSADKDVYLSHNKSSIIVKNIPNCFLPLDFEPSYNSESKIIISVGRLDNIKQFNQAIEAAKIVFAQCPDWKWEIYGDGPNKCSLLMQIEESGLTGKVVLCGHQEDKKIVFNNKSFLVLTSKFEGFGMVLLEALQYKLPVISYDVRFGPKEIVQDGINGYLTPANDVQKLAETVSRMINDKEQRVLLAQNTEKTIERFSKERVVEEWIELFETIINK